jgi:hypothetical protein
VNPKARRRVFTSGTRLTFRNSSAVVGRASRSAAAAVLTWDSVMGRMVLSGKGVSLPSARILAVIIVSLMFSARGRARLRCQCLTIADIKGSTSAN